MTSKHISDHVFPSEEGTKTRLIEELHKAPVKFTGKRVALKYPVRVKEESTVESVGLQDAERYRFEARIGSHFFRFPNVPEAARQKEYELLLRSVTEHIYGEVRAVAYRLLPHAHNVDDVEAREELMQGLDLILRMTKP